MAWSDSTLLLYAIAVAAVSIYFPYLFVAYARFRVGYDLSAPRAMFDKLPPYAQRAMWAHQNAFETFVTFLAAGLVAYVTGVSSPWASSAAVVFMVARWLYSAFYILDLPLLRSTAFIIGSFATATLFALGLLSATLA
ncbi:MAG: MAPEG family protein [Cyanobacteria bacterium SID2]|nr:MAPEG family protein [Cyanobacteria bacterium SID2]MBP0002344.1 MAPEG family protein [Cyanobacteria bacterium SBC]